MNWNVAARWLVRIIIVGAVEAGGFWTYLNWDWIIWYSEANAVWLQVFTSALQALSALVAIPAALFAASYGARKSAEEAHKRSEKKDELAKEEQNKATRQLLHLEIERNLNSIKAFSIAFDDLAENESEDVSDEEQFFEEQRLIIFYAPHLSFYSWHGLQLSSLLPLAFTNREKEIRKVDDLYSRLERLKKIEATLVKLSEENMTHQNNFALQQRTALVSEFRTHVQRLSVEENPIALS